MNDTLKLRVDYFQTANYSLVHNHVPIFQVIEIENLSDSPLADVQLTISGEYLKETSSQMFAAIDSKKTLKITDVNVLLDAGKLASLSEKVVTSFNVLVSSKGEAIHSETFPLDLTAFDQWLGSNIIPQCLASFVMPNLAVINEIVVKAAANLKEMTGSSSFTGYQSGNPNEVLMQVAAVFKTLHSAGIVYRGMPASFESSGQRVTLPDQVFMGKIGNCIELSLLFASVLESIELNPILVLTKGHCFLGVWLVEDSYSHSIGDDSSFLEKKCADGISEIALIESTLITAESTSFEAAMQQGEKNLAKADDFDMFIDIHRCRLERFLPLPMRTFKDGAWSVDIEGVEHEYANVDVPHHTRYDLEKVMSSQRQLTKLDIWERKLLDFSLRNAMLNLYLRRKAIQFISFNVDKIEDHLQDGEEYCIYAKPDVPFAVNDQERLLQSKQYANLQPLVTDDIEHHVLHTYQTEGETAATLKTIYRAARTSMEETGANSLFLAIGTLRWYETDKSEQPRYAPILLLPVEMVYKKGHYYIRTRDEGVTLNITLMEFIRQNYDIDTSSLSVLPTDEHGVDVQMIFTILRSILKNQKRWNVEEECLLGTFSFSKFLMWNDIHSNSNLMLQNPVIESLVKGCLTWQPTEMLTQLSDLDRQVKPSEMAIPVSVDSSQMSAVYEAGKGNSFILFGPPGTGKSQTITNLIANALYQGKRVLFVAEKMAALSVVQNRLEKIGLGPFCLELHSNKSTKKHILQQLESALNVAHIQRPKDFQSTADELFEKRKTLIDYIDALHTKGADGFSLYDSIVRYEALSEDAMDIASTASISLLTASSIKDYEYKLGGPLAALVSLVGMPADNPLHDFIIKKEALANQPELMSSLRHLLALIDEMQGAQGRERMDKTIEFVETLDKASALSGAPIASLMNGEKAEVVKATVAKISACESSRAHILSYCREEILTQDAVALSMEWNAIKGKWFIPRFFASNSFVKKMQFFSASLKKSTVDALLDELLAFKKLVKECDEMKQNAEKAMLGFIDFDRVKEKIQRWISNENKLRDWYQWCDFRSQLIAMQLERVVAALEDGSIQDVNSVGGSFFKGFFRCKCKEKIAAADNLCTFEGMVFDEQVKHYKTLTEEFQTLCKKELYARLAANVPRLTDNLDNSSEVGLLNRNISNGGRGLSIRDLFDQIPELLPRLCPCMLMSPMSVAQYIDLGQKKFDLVIFDEASQMPTSEAVGAIARGNALVVVGDPKQMPPTSFFSSSNVEEDEADIDDMESILEDCRTLSIPSLQLSWHYRSRHESLIAFSNNEYYDGSLITFPSIDDKQTKVNYVPVKGFYDKGGKRNNRAEAEAIVAEIERRLLDSELRKFSIGVISFSVVQQNLIEDILTDKLESDKKLAEIAEQMYEPIFVKNLENVQGDERDVILFSVGYGPDKDGHVSMNFGPLNNSGGERRLNVAVSRARHEMLVFSTLHSSHIDLRRTKARGVEGLKHFLEYAEFQTLPSLPVNTVREADSVVANQLGEALRERGFDVQLCVGRSQFKVDLAIVDKDNPETYSLGILLDGEEYRQTQTTRDREIVQPSVLESLSWRVVRVWSVDWYNNPERVIERIISANNEKATSKKAEKKSAPIVFDISKEKIEEVVSAGKAYNRFTGTSSSGNVTAKIVKDIVKAEQPITFNLLCRRVAEATGKPRVTPTIQQAVQDIVEKLCVRKDRSSMVVYLTEEDAESFEGYRMDSGRDINDIPLIEIENALIEVVRQQVSLAADNATLIAAKQLGFTRRGANVESAFHDAIEWLVREGKLVNENDKLRIG